MLAVRPAAGLVVISLMTEKKTYKIGRERGRGGRREEERKGGEK